VPETACDKEIPTFLQKALSDLRRWEGRSRNGLALPSAYLFITNRPFEHDLNGTAFRCSTVAEGFQIPEFKSEGRFSSLREALIARKAHADMHRLLTSLIEHAEIPATFDGEIPEFAFGGVGNRLVVGRVYLVRDNKGIEQPGKLMTATVLEADKMAYCAFALRSGESVIATIPMTDSEIDAYRRYPETFFGMPMQPNRRSTSPLDLYDFFYESYRRTTKERLLELLEILGTPDLGQIKALSQEELAALYSERCTYAVLGRQKNSPADKPSANVDSL